MPKLFHDLAPEYPSKEEKKEIEAKKDEIPVIPDHSRTRTDMDRSKVYIKLPVEDERIYKRPDTDPELATYHPEMTEPTDLVVYSDGRVETWGGGSVREEVAQQALDLARRHYPEVFNKEK